MPKLGHNRDAAAGVKPGDITNLAAPNADDIARPSRWSDTVQMLRKQLDELPDVRQDRVNPLKQAIRDGAYKISPYAIATAMLADLGL